MAELDDQQTLTDLGSEEAVQTPLDSILEGNATDAPAAQSDEGELGGTDAPKVPLVALKRERERRQKADKQVEELRLELERFDNAKFGWDETVAEEEKRFAQEEQQRVDEASQDPAVVNYGKSLGRFTAIHGKDVVAKVDAGLNRLNVEQRQHVMHLTGSQADPVAAIHAYVDGLGLLDFKGAPIDQILTKDKAAPGQQATDPQLAQHYAELNRHGQEVAQAERRTAVALSETRFISRHGADAYDALDRLSIELAQSGHPVGQQFVQAVQTSSDPVSTAAQILAELGLWQQEAQQQPQQQQPRQTFPSNLANRRNMGQRNGPAYGGPTPLNDIFKH